MNSGLIIHIKTDWIRLSGKVSSSVSLRTIPPHLPSNKPRTSLVIPPLSGSGQACLVVRGPVERDEGPAPRPQNSCCPGLRARRVASTLQGVCRCSRSPMPGTNVPKPIAGFVSYCRIGGLHLYFNRVCFVLNSNLSVRMTDFSLNFSSFLLFILITLQAWASWCGGPPGRGGLEGQGALSSHVCTRFHMADSATTGV